MTKFYIDKDKVGEFWGHFRVKAKDNVAKSVVDEAKSINSRVENWVYSLPAHKYRYMTRKVEDVLYIKLKIRTSFVTTSLLCY